jgi:hypothetical protein
MNTKIKHKDMNMNMITNNGGLGGNIGGRHIKFHSPQGGGTDCVVPEVGGNKLTLRNCIEEYERTHGFRHTLEQYHFSINAEEIESMDMPLSYVSGDMLVATLAKVGGSKLT